MITPPPTPFGRSLGAPEEGLEGFEPVGEGTLDPIRFTLNSSTINLARGQLYEEVLPFAGITGGDGTYSVKWRSQGTVPPSSSALVLVPDGSLDKLWDDGQVRFLGVQVATNTPLKVFVYNFTISSPGVDDVTGSVQFRISNPAVAPSNVQWQSGHTTVLSIKQGVGTTRIIGRIYPRTATTTVVMSPKVPGISLRFTNDTVDNIPGQRVNMSFGNVAAGNYVIRLTVSDSTGASDSITVTVNVARAIAAATAGSLVYHNTLALDKVVPIDISAAAPGQTGYVRKLTSAAEDLVVAWTGRIVTNDIQLYEDGDGSVDHQSRTARALRCNFTLHAGATARGILIDFFLGSIHSQQAAVLARFVSAVADPGNDGSLNRLSPAIWWRPFSFTLAGAGSSTGPLYDASAVNTASSAAIVALWTTRFPSSPEFRLDLARQDPVAQFWMPLDHSENGSRLVAQHAFNHQRPPVLEIQRIHFPYTGADLSGLL